MKYIALVIIICLIPAIQQVYPQDGNKKEYSLVIRQTILPGSNPDIEYRVQNSKIKIFKIKSNRSDRESRRLILKRNIKSIENSLIKLLSSEKISSLEDNYSGAEIDGIWWEFNINTSANEKKIRVSNYYVKELDELLEILNSQIPDNKRYITFDYFNIKQNAIKRTTSNMRYN